MGGFVILLGALMGKILIDPEGTGIVRWDPSTVAAPSDVRTTADGGQYAFLETQEDSDEPVTYDPCQPVRVVVNTRTGPPDAMVLVADALDEMADLTGLTFDLDGVVTTAPSIDWQFDEADDGWQPVLVAWTDEDAVDELDGTVLGVGGSVWSDQDGARRYVTGQVLLDGPQLTSLGPDETRATLLHELGHLVGLDHVGDEDSLMQPYSGPDEWGSGDLAGLERLGRGSCAETPG